MKHYPLADTGFLVIQVSKKEDNSGFLEGGWLLWPTNWVNA